MSFVVREGVATLEVADNGVGFDAATTTPATAPASSEMGYGMLSMAERADLVGGTLTARSRPGEGTTVTVAVPSEGGVVSPGSIPRPAD